LEFINLPGIGKCKVDCKQQRQNYDFHENLQNSKRIINKDMPPNGKFVNRSDFFHAPNHSAFVWTL
jgi:hypothetical protein